MRLVIYMMDAHRLPQFMLVSELAQRDADAIHQGTHHAGRRHSA